MCIRDSLGSECLQTDSLGSECIQEDPHWSECVQADSLGSEQYVFKRKILFIYNKKCYLNYEISYCKSFNTPFPFCSCGVTCVFFKQSGVINREIIIKKS